MTLRDTQEPAASAEPATVTFRSGDENCHAWYFPAECADLDGPAGRPVAVMAHGFGGTKDSGLEPFARAYAAAGIDVLAFDFRYFGASGGRPRQRVRMAEQLADYRAAVLAAARLPGVDPHRVVLWGVSLSGGHVFAAGAAASATAPDSAAVRASVAALVSVTPLVDGRAAGVLAVRESGITGVLRGTFGAVRAGLAGVTGGSGLIPLVGRPGDVAALTPDGYYESYRALAGPTWRNEIDPTVLLQLSGYRPARAAAALNLPVLVQIADFDRGAPPYAAAKAAFAARAEVRHYPCDHFGVWPGNPFFDAAVAHQLLFLRRHLALDESSGTRSSAGAR
ncbi:alpha/beta hydrolase [Nocardia jinanensis]|uniref:Alpha/beta hydrolase n=1 Tax=Nocardia jinanensis TaxID=382504 RepID=A0A917RPN2_9NOCA|nr:alpha/beta fold hydrolase [Nocardia jinanensis]GGL17749.1 alpha/beta hydrolase [Nocardia jinanensis]